MTVEIRENASEKTTGLSESNSMMEGMVRVLEGVRVESGYTPDRDRQRAVLANLPENLVEQLRGHLHVAYKEREFFMSVRGESVNKFDDRAVISGELFELLVENDSSLNQKTKVSEEFLALMHDPERFRLGQQLGQYRNPDLATFQEDSFVIASVGEAKLGLFGFRAYQQLSEHGFAQGISAAVNLLNVRGDLQEFGLTNLASVLQEGHRLYVGEDFKQVLVVPANRSTQVDSLINSREFRNPRDYDLFAELLEDRQKIEIKKALFSVAEVNALVESILPQVLAEIKEK